MSMAQPPVAPNPGSTGTPEMDPAADPGAAAAAAAAAIAAATSVPAHDVALVLGSGWRDVADRLGETIAEVPLGDLPGFLTPAVAGHGGTLRSIRTAGGRAVLALLGRTHPYEGVGLARVVHGVRTAAATGVRAVVLTNAAGGISEGLSVGQVVLISDHLNLTARSPLVGPQFIDLTDAYSTRLRVLARELDSTLAEGVYAALPGPHFETPAEIRMLRGFGADLVGMSTVHETIAARALGVEVLGLSLVTNLAAGLSGSEIDHADVLAVGQAAARGASGLLGELIDRI